MKKFLSLLSLCTMLLCGSANSQKAKVGISAGGTIGSYKIKAESVSLTSKGKAGITVGIFADVPLGGSGSFMPALNFVQKGGTLKSEGIKDKLTSNYLELPLNFVRNAKLSNGKFFIGGGPSLNVGISGKNKWEAEGSSGNDKIKFGKDEDFRRFDVGLNVVTGFVAKSGTMLSLNYNYGVSNSVDAGDSDGKFRNRYVGLRIGVLL